MAKRKSAGGVNKAEKIREYFKAHPNAKGVEVVKALAAEGVKVAAAQVSNVKLALKKGGKRRAGAGATVAASTGHLLGDEVGNRFWGGDEFGNGFVKLVQAGTRLLDAFGGDLKKAQAFLARLS